MNRKFTDEQRKKELDLIFMIIDSHNHEPNKQLLALSGSNRRTDDLNKLSMAEIISLKVSIVNRFLKLELTTDIEALAFEMNLGKDEGLTTLEAIDNILHASEISKEHYWELDKTELYRLKGVIEILHAAYLAKLNISPANATASLLKELGIKVESSPKNKKECKK